MPMPTATESGSNAGAQINGCDALRVIEALYDLELQANIAVIREEQRDERRHRSLAEWSSYWPVALGILGSFFAPQLREFVDGFRPWGLWGSFPLVALSLQPEMRMGSWMAAMLPTAAMYLQFPLEGLLARFTLRKGLTVRRVIEQVGCFHGLCIVDLWLLNGWVGHLMHQLGH